MKTELKSLINTLGNSTATYTKPFIHIKPVRSAICNFTTLNHSKRHHKSSFFF